MGWVHGLSLSSFFSSSKYHTERRVVNMIELLGLFFGFERSLGLVANLAGRMAFRNCS